MNKTGQAIKIIKDPTKRSRAIIGALQRGNYFLAFYLTTCPEFVIKTIIENQKKR